MYESSQPPPRPDRRRRGPGRLVLVIGAVVALLLGVGLAGVAATRLLGDDPAESQWQAEPSGGGGVPGSESPSAGPTAAQVISLSATGDIVMGNAPARLPANGGKGFFDSVKPALAADLVMGNLEEPITDDTGTSKCGAGSTQCHQFRVPPSYAGHLKEAGFGLLNQANNHGYDYGAAGYRNTQKHLEEQGLANTGAPDQITVVDVKGVKVAVVGFSSYPWNNSLVDIPAAAEVIKKAATQADLVVVQVHMGGEGTDKIHVKPGTEMFLGENRGDPVKFSHAMIDAGADLIVGHGPHVLRGMEFYQGRLIAYSLGNFAGGAGALNNSGRLGWGGVLKVSLAADGGWSGGEFVSTYMNSAGKPTLDTQKRGLKAVQELSTADFDNSAATLDTAGKISPPV
ncbi:CapA family protein [Micromonospora sp. NPDC049523]|uniref:CapA family protein n=1 Tax=Micromonospora sp. NPDC049523 TaxID=3155921 RepID=UPI003419BD19